MQLLIIALFLFKNSVAQNLIENGSFESTTNLNCLVDPYNYVDFWIPIRSPDYFNAICTSGGYKVPNNTFGISYAKNGNAYVGIAVYIKTTEAKEYIQQQLNNSLISGKSYYVSFYVSSSDRYTMAIKNVGAYFSVSQPTVAGNTYFPANPQVVNNTIYLTDTAGWSKIEGYFTAQGGEQYITIGNFNSNTNTDTLYTGSNDPAPGNPDGAYYYIDSVSLYDSLDYVTNIKKHESDFKINLYPNPSKGLMELDYDLGNNIDGKMNLYDVTGKLISSYNLDSNKGILQMNEQNLNNGVYFYHILVGEKTLKTDKIVIIK